MSHCFQLAEVNEYMKFRKLPLDLQLRIQDYFEHRYQRKLFDEKGILNYESMSYPLRKVRRGWKSVG